MTALISTPREAARVAAKLAPELRDALCAWAKRGTSCAIGAVLDDKPRTSYAIRPHVIGPRQVDVLRKHQLAETRVLWLCLTPRGVIVARWLANITDETAVAS